MVRYVLDTDHISLFIGNHPQTNERGIQEFTNCAITIISVQEVFNGWVGQLGKISPEESQIRELIANGVICSDVDLEKWLLYWELENFNVQDISHTLNDEYFKWEEPYGVEATLLLLPIENGWDSLAYLHWWAACFAGTTACINFLKRWHRKYDAEIVCHYGTSLQFKVGKRPPTLEDAFNLACEQKALAGCTIHLPGVTLRDHARTLLVVDRWFIHESP